jgi:hypothetical protein
MMTNLGLLTTYISLLFNLDLIQIKRGTKMDKYGQKAHLNRSIHIEFKYK